MISVYGFQVKTVDQIPEKARKHLLLMSYKSISDAFIKQKLCNGEKPNSVADEFGFSRSYIRIKGSQVYLNPHPNIKHK